MATSMDRALKEGEVTSLEKNRADIELANMQNQCGLKKIELESALEQLQNLNGGNPIRIQRLAFCFTPEEVIPLLNR